MEGEAVQSASVLAGYYFLAGNETLRQQQKEDKPALDLEEIFLDILEVLPSLDSIPCPTPPYIPYLPGCDNLLEL